MYIFVDESGDLGSKKGSSRFFVLTALVVPELKPLEKAVKSFRRSLPKKLKNIVEFHANKERPCYRKKLLIRLCKISGIAVFFIISEKKRDLTASQQENLYFKFLEQLLLTCVEKKGELKEVFITIDKKYNKKSTPNSFTERVILEIRKKFLVNPLISFLLSDASKGLQAVDFISWSIFRHFEHADSEYYDLVKDKIVGKKTV